MGNHDDKYLELHEQADEARKQADVDRATSLYADAIRHCERATDSIDSGLPPAPYREVAKMLYHLGEIDLPIAILDRHSEFEKRHGREPDGELVELREELANEEMQRQAWRYE